MEQLGLKEKQDLRLKLVLKERPDPKGKLGLRE
jgi:hypothetical protein